MKTFLEDVKNLLTSEVDNQRLNLWLYLSLSKGLFIPNKNEKDQTASKTRKHSRWMRTTCCIDSVTGLPTHPPPPADPPVGRLPPGCRPPVEAEPPPRQTTCRKTRFPPVNRMTDTSENITLPQTSFADGKN